MKIRTSRTFRQNVTKNRGKVTKLTPNIQKLKISTEVISCGHLSRIEKQSGSV